MSMSASSDNAQKIQDEEKTNNLKQENAAESLPSAPVSSPQLGPSEETRTMPTDEEVLWLLTHIAFYHEDVCSNRIHVSLCRIPEYCPIGGATVFRCRGNCEGNTA